jgi:hypothetical protein
MWHFIAVIRRQFSAVMTVVYCRHLSELLGHQNPAFGPADGDNLDVSHVESLSYNDLAWRKPVGVEPTCGTK